MWFLLGKGVGFYKFFGGRPTKWPIAKKIMLWDAPQLIKLINMNHNKYLALVKV
jgi:hypothetical protein